MKRILLTAAALAPMMALAGGDKDLASWDYKGLEDDQRVSELLGTAARTQGGSEVGVISDVVLAEDGRVSVLIAGDESGDASLQETSGGSGAAGEDSPVTRDDTNYQATDDLSRSSAAADAAAGSVATVSWDDVDYDEQSGTATLTTENVDFEASTEWAAGGDQAVTESGSATARHTGSATHGEDDLGPSDEGGAPGSAAGDAGLLASNVVGMDVNLADEDSAGRIEDVLIDDGGNVTAFVIDGWEGADKQRIAVPADIGAIDESAGEVDLSYSRDELDQLGEFSFDEPVE